MSTRYQRLASSAYDADRREEEDELTHEHPYTSTTIAEFNRPPPAWWKRALVVFAIFALGYAAWSISQIGRNKPKVIYATRYSEEFKYRPAASPVITEYLKDGRIRLRGASPGGVGVQPGDLPLSPREKTALEKAKKRQAEEEATKLLKERKRKRKERRLEAKRRAAATRPRNAEL